MKCTFCEIIQGQRPSRQVYQDDIAFAFHDINPQAPVHILIIPRKHIPSLNELTLEDRETIGHLFYLAKEIAAQNGIDKTGYRTVINTNYQAGQSVYHLHLHLIGGRPMRWPPG